ncbi:MAG: geranylgeranyl reductase family protein [Actinomycetota bacterium]
MTSFDCDVLIVGAGPAGSAAAIDAAQAGLSTVMVDKTEFPRDKCCGDGLTAGALRTLDDLGLDRSALPSWMQVDDVVLRSPRGREIVFPLPRDSGAFAAVCRRRELDAALVTMAEKAGATVRQNTPLTAVSTTDDAVVAEAGGATITARWLVAADGMWSPTRKMLGLATPRYLGEWHAFRQYMVGVSDRAASELIVWFEPDLLPGYVWSFPLGDGTANVGFGIQRGGRHNTQDMKDLWPEILTRPHIAEFLGPDAQPEAAHRAWPIPARLGRSPLTSGRVLFVGDAAAATDPMTGEGIGQALDTGRAAVAALAGDPATAVDVVAERYRTDLRRGMQRDHALARTLSNVLSSPRGATLAIDVAGATPWTRKNFVRWLFEDYPRAAVATPHRWRRDLFAAPGAFAATSAAVSE